MESKLSKVVCCCNLIRAFWVVSILEIFSMCYGVIGTGVLYSYWRSEFERERNSPTGLTSLIVNGVQRKSLLGGLIMAEHGLALLLIACVGLLIGLVVIVVALIGLNRRNSKLFLPRLIAQPLAAACLIVAMIISTVDSATLQQRVIEKNGDYWYNSPAMIAYFVYVESTVAALLFEIFSAFVVIRIYFCLKDK